MTSADTPQERSRRGRRPARPTPAGAEPGPTDAGRSATLGEGSAAADPRSVLRLLAAEVSGRSDLAGVIDDMLDHSVALFGADRAGLWTVEPGDHPFRLAAHRGLGEAFLGIVARIERGRKAAGIRAIEERRTIVLDQPTRQETTVELRRAYRAEGIRSICFVPIVFVGEPLGLLVLYHLAPHEWPLEELDLVEGFADQVAVALQNARLYSSVQGFAARLGAIKDLAGQLNRIHDVGEIGRAIVEQIREVYDSDTATFYTIDREAGMCEPVAFSGTFLGSRDPDPEALRIPVGTGLTGWVAEHNEPLRIADTRRDQRRRVIGADEPDSMLFAPVAYGDRAIGVIVVSKAGVDHYSAEDLTTLSIFAGFAGQALANAENIGRLRAQQGELERRLAGQRTLLSVNETLLTAADPATVFERIADGLITVVRYDNITIYRLDRERGIRVAVLARDRYAD
ncbi:MAG: GAF domain-containing protein, partial [Chloroflexota bacterium]